MEKCKKKYSDFFLPEVLIQHIQSFLSAKEAARTSLISKSWYTAWLTRSNLVFDERDFEWNDDGFWEFVKKTMQRYDELNLRIQCLKFWMTIRPLQKQYSYFLADELIVGAMKLGASDINFELDRWDPAFVLPREVFESETLTRLSVTGCKIALGVDQKASCSRLESLSLHKVYTDGDILWNIISSCPLIEKLSLSECFVAPTSDFLLPSRPFNKFSGLVVNGLMKGFSKLKCLFLEEVHIDTSFFDDFSSKFPCLKDLSVHCCDGYDRIRIDSSSLEYLSFVQKNTILRAGFDVPCIRKFVFKGDYLPSLSFKEDSRRWKLDISFTICSHRASWFVGLKRLLAKLSRYEISLSLWILNFWDNSILKFLSHRDAQGSPIAIEDLTLEVPSSISSSFLDGLFWSCRPNFITLHFFPTGERNNDFLQKLIHKVSILNQSNSGLHDLEKVSIPYGSNLGLHDLEKVVNVEAFDENLVEWQPLPLKTLLGSSKTYLGSSMSSKYKLRFHLRWDESLYK